MAVSGLPRRNGPYRRPPAEEGAENAADARPPVRRFGEGTLRPSRRGCLGPSEEPEGRVDVPRITEALPKRGDMCEPGSVPCGVFPERTHRVPTTGGAGALGEETAKPSPVHRARPDTCYPQGRAVRS